MKKKKKIEDIKKTILNGSHWVFLCFTPDRVDRVAEMFGELVLKHDLNA